MFKTQCGFSCRCYNVPSKLTKNLLQADELVDMVWIWIDAQERLRKVARCKIGQVQSFSQMMKTFYIPDKWLAYAWFEITSYLKDTSLRLEEPLWRSPGPMTICLKQLFVVRELFRSDWNIQPCVIQIKKHNYMIQYQRYSLQNWKTWLTLHSERNSFRHPK